MWTEEKLDKAAEEYYREAYNRLGYVETDVIDAFLEGARFIINNIQKENESVS